MLKLNQNSLPWCTHLSWFNFYLCFKIFQTNLVQSKWKRKCGTSNLLHWHIWWNLQQLLRGPSRDIENITWLCGDEKFILQCSKIFQEWNTFQHEKISFISPSGQGNSFFFCIHNTKQHLWRFSEDFWLLSDKSPRFSKICLKATPTLSNILQRFSRSLKITKDNQRWWKKTPRTPTDLSIVKGEKQNCYRKWCLHTWGYHIFTCEEIV